MDNIEPLENSVILLHDTGDTTYIAGIPRRPANPTDEGYVNLPSDCDFDANLEKEKGVPTDDEEWNDASLPRIPQKVHCRSDRKRKEDPLNITPRQPSYEFCFSEPDTPPDVPDTPTPTGFRKGFPTYQKNDKGSSKGTRCRLPYSETAAISATNSWPPSVAECLDDHAALNFTQESELSGQLNYEGGFEHEDRKTYCVIRKDELQEVIDLDTPTSKTAIKLRELKHKRCIENYYIPPHERQISTPPTETPSGPPQNTTDQPTQQPCKENLQKKPSRSALKLVLYRKICIALKSKVNAAYTNEDLEKLVKSNYKLLQTTSTRKHDLLVLPPDEMIPKLWNNAMGWVIRTASTQEDVIKDKYPAEMYIRVTMQLVVMQWKLLLEEEMRRRLEGPVIQIVGEFKGYNTELIGKLKKHSFEGMLML